MAGAGDEAERGYKEFHSLSREWAWQFTILKAKVLYSRGMSDETLKLLASEPNPPLSGDLAVQKKRLEAVAQASSLRLTEAEAVLTGAESICAASAYPACADLVTARGFLEMERGHYIQAQASFERALASARAAGDQFLEATALLNLSWSTNEQTHFDEALDWSNAARKISLAQGYADLSQTALGNMGWAYYRFGDPEKAEGMFTEAKAQADADQQAHDAADAAQEALDNATQARDQLESDGASQDQIDAANQAIAQARANNDAAEAAAQSADDAMNGQ